MKIKLTELIEDFDLYPRASVDAGHVGQIAEALEAGAKLPPIIIESKTKRIVDGFHRARAHRRVFGDDSEIEVEARHFKDDAHLFLEAMRLNASHGRNLTSFDRTVAAEKAFRFDLDPKVIAGALNLSIEKVQSLRTSRCARLENSRKIVPLKTPIMHLAGKEISKEQREVISKLGGNTQLFFVHQLLILIRNKLIDMSNDKMLKALAELRDEIDKLI